ncbi:hypothetical protein HOK00_00700 [bacterium]|nr:hypothetical protein [bacterium]
MNKILLGLSVLSMSFSSLYADKTINFNNSLNGIMKLSDVSLVNLDKELRSSIENLKISLLNKRSEKIKLLNIELKNETQEYEAIIEYQKYLIKKMNMNRYVTQVYNLEEMKKNLTSSKETHRDFVNQIEGEIKCLSKPEESMEVCYASEKPLFRNIEKISLIKEELNKKIELHRKEVFANLNDSLNLYKSKTTTTFNKVKLSLEKLEINSVVSK